MRKFKTIKRDKIEKVEFTKSKGYSVLDAIDQKLKGYKAFRVIVEGEGTYAIMKMNDCSFGNEVYTFTKMIDKADEVAGAKNAEVRVELWK